MIGLEESFWNRSLGYLHLLPDFLIIGVQRGGTTSLYNYLVGHPCIAAARMKEVHFFDVHFQQGLGWYRRQFPPFWTKYSARPQGRPALITGEASPYYIFHPLAPQRIATWLPQAKLLVLLRNPVERAYSHYRWIEKLGNENLSFEQALECEAARLQGEVEKIVREPGYYSLSHQHYAYLARGLYADQLQVWFTLFPREQLYIESSEGFFQDPAAVLRRAFEFLQVPPWEPSEYRKFNEGGYPPMNPATRQRLVEYFEPHNRRLYELLGKDLHWA